MSHFKKKRLPFDLAYDTDVQIAFRTNKQLRRAIKQQVPEARAVRFPLNALCQDPFTGKITNGLMVVTLRRGVSDPTGPENAIMAIIAANPGAMVNASGELPPVGAPEPPCPPALKLAVLDATAGIAYAGASDFEYDPAATGGGRIRLEGGVFQPSNDMGQLDTNGVYTHLPNSSPPLASARLVIFSLATNRTDTDATLRQIWALRANQAFTIKSAGGQDTVLSLQDDLIVRSAGPNNVAVSAVLSDAGDLFVTAIDTDAGVACEVLVNGADVLNGATGFGAFEIASGINAATDYSIACIEGIRA